MMDKVSKICLDLGAEYYFTNLAYFASLMGDPDSGELDTLSMSPDVFVMALKAKKVADPHLPNYNQVMRGPYREEFLLAMVMRSSSYKSMAQWLVLREVLYHPRPMYCHLHGHSESIGCQIKPLASSKQDSVS